jgi:hypothetical protein
VTTARSGNDGADRRRLLFADDQALFDRNDKVGTQLFRQHIAHTDDQSSMHIGPDVGRFEEGVHAGKWRAHKEFLHLAAAIILR